MSEMPPLKFSTVVILEDERLHADMLADRFRSLGARVHVVSKPAAVETLVRNKRVDVVFVGFALRDEAGSLKKVLAELGVPHITCATPADTSSFLTELDAVSGQAVN